MAQSTQIIRAMLLFCGLFLLYATQQLVLTRSDPPTHTREHTPQTQQTGSTSQQTGSTSQQTGSTSQHTDSAPQHTDPMSLERVLDAFDSYSQAVKHPERVERTPLLQLRQHVDKLVNQVVGPEPFYSKQPIPDFNKAANVTAGVFILAENRYLHRAMRKCRGLMHSLPLLWKNFLSIHRYPLYILHEANFPAKYREAIISTYPGTIHFVEVTFPQKPASIESNMRNRFAKETPEGYMGMCQFWFHDFLYMNTLKDMEYVLRIDTDSCIESPILEDPFKRMKEQGTKYGYKFRFTELLSSMEHLVEATSQYAVDNKIDVKGCNKFVSNKPEKLLNFCKSYKEGQCRMGVYSTNFEFMHLETFRSPKFRAYADFILEQGGIYKYRWGDAPLRTFQAQMFLKSSEVENVCEFEYTHSLWKHRDSCHKKETGRSVFGC